MGPSQHPTQWLPEVITLRVKYTGPEADNSSLEPSSRISGAIPPLTNTLLIMKVNEMHYFSDLFDKVSYISRRGPLPIIRSISTLYIRNRYLSCQFCWMSASVVRISTLADSQQNQHDKYLLRVHSVEILLMMDGGPVRNMQSTLSNKFEKQCISLALIIRIYHDARSSECRIYQISLYDVHRQPCY